MFVRTREGVFVMVTMGVSTVSVIESIIVIRLCTSQAAATPLPSAVRFVAFRVIGRTLGVSCPSTRVCPTNAQSSRRSLDRCSSQNVKDGADDMKRHSSNTALTDVVNELRKVSDLPSSSPQTR